MCVLIVHWRQVPGYPVVVAANRDEAYDRPSSAPAFRDSGRVFAPQDLRAGGTWLGVNRHGLFTAITNRAEVRNDPKRRSRGELCQQALAARSTADAVRRVRQAVAGHPRNGFNLIIADRDEAVVLTGSTDVNLRRLPPGTHVLTNRHELNALQLGDLTPPLEIDEALARLAEISKDHDERDGYHICKHGERGGTVSSALIAIAEEAPGGIVFRYAPGPPCRTPYASLDRELAGWLDSISTPDRREGSD